MEYTDRAATSDLTPIETERPVLNGDMPQRPEAYNFYQLSELLQRMLDEDPEDDSWELDYRLRYSASRGLGFPASDIEGLSENYGQLSLETTFFGLSGAQSPLPSFYLERILTEDETGLRGDFLDFFNHRLIALVYRVWRKYRYYIRFREDASDDFSAQLFALVGLADSDLRGDTPINWCKMLAYAGMLAGRSRSPQVVSGIVAHCFDLKKVSIEQWVYRRVPVPEQQMFLLGMANSQLGYDSVVGASVADCTGKFILRIQGLTLRRFMDFLPSGKEYEPLCKVVEFILREQMAYDLDLELRPAETPAMVLGEEKGSRLGWTSFVGQTEGHRRVRIQIRA